MSCNLTTGFPQDCSNTAGGLTEIYIAPLAQKGTLTIVSGSVANTGSFLVSGSGAQFYKYVPRLGTAQASCEQKTSMANGSVYYEPSVVFALPRTDVQKRNEVTLLGQMNVMIIVKDNTFTTGSYWLYGSQNGMLNSGKQDTGKSYGDLNGYTYNFGQAMEAYDIVSVPTSLMTALTTPA